jgi:hypothetical protein
MNFARRGLLNVLLFARPSSKRLLIPKCFYQIVLLFDADGATQRPQQPSHTDDVDV